MDCFGPIGGLLAFFGALGIILALFGALVGWIQYSTDKVSYQNKTPGGIRVATSGAILVTLVVIGGFINQAFIPAGCIPH